MQSERIVSDSISSAVKEYLDKNKAELNNIAINLLKEKIFIDSREYTVEISKRNRLFPQRENSASDEEISFAKKTLEDMLNFSLFKEFSVTIENKPCYCLLKINAPGKDGLIIGKNGRNFNSLQYLLLLALEKKFHRYVPVLIDAGSYREKRIKHLKSLCSELIRFVSEKPDEKITDFLPSYERKLIHEEITPIKGISTFSIGKGPYKKVVITTLL
ncbi:MAG TPA: hypothetical protein ENN55_03960 [Firmicutes bacterium]|nr:hypothetical protein [Bacillota bacterium]